MRIDQYLAMKLRKTEAERDRWRDAALEPANVVVVEAGCAECHGGPPEPLIEIRQFGSVAEAKAFYADQGWLSYGKREINWVEHPQGGEHVVVGQGSVWITQLNTPIRMFEDPE